MAKHLFSEIVFDLDTRRIVSYKLKPWADDFLMLRMELYHEEFGDLEEGGEGYESALEKANSSTLLGCWNAMPHRGSTPQLASMFGWLLFTSWRCSTKAPFPLNRRTIWCLRRRNVMRKSGHATKTVRPGPASLGLTVSRNNESIRSFEGGARQKSRSVLGMTRAAL
jgi:hypothetical protein